MTPSLDLRAKSLAELQRIAKRELNLTPEDIDASGQSPHKKKSWIEAIIRGRTAKRFVERPKPTVKPLPQIKLIQIYPRPQNQTIQPPP